jgi:hypothetical protein
MPRPTMMALARERSLHKKKWNACWARNRRMGKKYCRRHDHLQKSVKIFCM